MPHADFLTTIGRIAEGNWGSQFKTKTDAEKALVDKPQELAAWALVELISRFNKFAKQIAGDKRYEADLVEKHSDAHPFPEKKVGDLLFDYDVDGGTSRYVVSAVLKDWFCLIVPCDEGTIAFKQRYACEWHIASEEEAMAKAAKLELPIARKRVDFCERLLASLEGGAPLDEFRTGIQEEEN